MTRQCFWKGQFPPGGNHGGDWGIDNEYPVVERLIITVAIVTVSVYYLLNADCVLGTLLTALQRELFGIYKKSISLSCVCIIIATCSTISDLVLWFLPLHSWEAIGVKAAVSHWQHVIVKYRVLEKCQLLWLVGEVGEGRATSSINERVGVGCVGMGKRVPSCPRKDEVGMERGLQEGGRVGDCLRHLLTWQFGPGLFQVQGHHLLTLLPWNFPIPAVRTGSICKIALHSPSDLLHIILVAVDLVYMPVFFQRFLRWRLNTHVIRSRQRKKGGSLWGRESKVKSEVRSGSQFLSEKPVRALVGPRVLPLSFW